jgi:prophage tail gpP-like protein/LysM repeat protein
MPKATPGIPYTIVSGDTLQGIAKQAYGEAKRWREIWKANESVLKSGNPNLIYPGEVITIPADSVKEAAVLDLFAEALPSLPDKDPDDFTIVVDDTEIPVISGRALRTADTASDGWSAVVRFDPDDQDLSAALHPYTYPKASCYLGGKLAVAGFVYGVEPSLKEKSRTATLEGWSSTIDIVDSTAKAPYEAENITLEERAIALVEAHGIQVVFDVDEDEPFDRVTIEPTETIFTHLAKLASQRGILVTSTELGELRFMRAASGKPVGTIEEESADGQNFSAKFDGRKRFNIYRALSQTPARKGSSKGNTKIQIAKDPIVPKSRTLTFSANETTGGQMKNAAEWRRSKQLAEALTIPMNVSSWYGPDGELWKENTIVTVKSPTIYVPDGFDFLIRRVEYVFNEKGTTAVLSLIPPQVYTGEALDEPWAPPALRQSNLIERLAAGIL